MPKKASRYLGITMDGELNWKLHIQEVKTRATKSMGALASLAGSTWGMSLKDMRRVYQAVVVPQIMYGCSAWSIAKDTGLGYTRKTIDTLNGLQARMARTIAGAFKATSGPALDTELFLLPMAQQIWKCNAESVNRLLSTHNIPGLVGFRSFRKKKRRERARPHLSPLEHIYRRLYQRRGPAIERQEIILPYLTPPWWQAPKTYIEASAEQATKKHEEQTANTQEYLHIYTDGSGINGEIGAAATSPMILNTMKAYMGDSDTSTVYAAELQGIRLALIMALKDWDKGNRRNKVIIYTDNQAAIRTVGNPTGKSGAYIIDDIVRLIDCLQATKRIQVEVRWVPAHTGILGNEIADIAAKEAAGWRAYEQMCAGNRAVPPARLYPLRTTLKTWIKQEAQKEWEYSWATETRGRACYRYTPKPTHKVLRLHEKRSKRHSSLLIQMRTEKIGLKDFLYQRGVPEITNPQCACGEGRQTVMHVLMRCRTFNDLRRQELSGIPGRRDLRAILNERKAATKAINFMEQTQILGQFRIME
jgi:ribonuclease HI